MEEVYGEKRRHSISHEREKRREKFLEKHARIAGQY
jgi:hypothetical protein